MFFLGFGLFIIPLGFFWNIFEVILKSIWDSFDLEWDGFGIILGWFFDQPSLEKHNVLLHAREDRFMVGHMAVAVAVVVADLILYLHRLPYMSDAGTFLGKSSISFFREPSEI